MVYRPGFKDDLGQTHDGEDGEDHQLSRKDLEAGDGGKDDEGGQKALPLVELAGFLQLFSALLAVETLVNVDLVY